MKRRLLSLLLCLAMVAECLPTAALAAAPQKAIELNVTQLEGGQRSSIYFGNYQQSDASGNTKEPVKWRVLANNENANGSLFLLATKIWTYSRAIRSMRTSPGKTVIYEHG